MKIKKLTTDLTKPYFVSAIFQTCFFSLLSSFNEEIRNLQVLHKRFTTRYNGNVQYHD